MIPAHHPRRRRTAASPAFFVAALVVTLIALLLLPSLGAGGGQPRQPLAPRPDRVLLVGDSLLYQSRSTVDRRFDELGVATSWIGGPGEGLLTRQSSWLDQIDHAVDTLDPDAVVIEACCNYAQRDDSELYVLPDGSAVARDSDLMHDLWESAARQAVARAGARGAEVHVVVAPTPVEGTFFELMVGSRMERFAATWRTIASDTPTVHLIEWTAIFEVEGEMATVLPEIGQVRHDDGLHIVGAGHDLVANRTVTAVVDRHAEAVATG